MSLDEKFVSYILYRIQHYFMQAVQSIPSTFIITDLKYIFRSPLHDEADLKIHSLIHEAQ